MLFSCVVISHDDAVPLELHTIEASSLSVEHDIQRFFPDDIGHRPDHHSPPEDATVDDIISTLLIRSRPKLRSRPSYQQNIHSNSSANDSLTYPPLYAYHIPWSSRRRQSPPPPTPPTTTTTTSSNPLPMDSARKNVRATRLAMACGHWSIRFYGTVVLTITTTTVSGSNHGNTARISPSMFQDIQTIASHCGPDVRDTIIATLSASDITSRFTITRSENTCITEWMGNAAQEQYHDRAIVQQFHNIFSKSAPPMDDLDTDEDHSQDDKDDEVNSSSDKKRGSGNGEIFCSDGLSDVNANAELRPTETTTSIKEQRPLIACDIGIDPAAKYLPNASTITWCYACRRPATTLCSKCHGVYFCNDICQRNGYGTGMFRGTCSVRKPPLTPTTIPFLTPIL